ncbi:MAG: ABC transporter substrate-binding protein [Candidatus Woesearchaeota archaeon]
MRQPGCRSGALASAVALAVGLAGLALAGCGGGTTSKPARAGGPVTVLMARAPNSLDPAVADTPQALEADWLVYTPLLAYGHASGLLGTSLLAGLATSPPVITDGGRAYALTLRSGLAYSNGEAVRASDFTWAVERAIRLRWRQAPQLITSRIVGAGAFAAGRARTISGITANDTTGRITIHLTAPWGSFDDVLALPVLAPIPRDTPLHDESERPPPGLGVYTFGKVVPGHSFSLLRNPRWHRGQIPGIPPAHVDVDVRITRNTRLNATSVLNNTADVFDSADQIPPVLLPRILQQAAGRYGKQAVNSTYLIFMNVTRRPFKSQLARIAVQTALDEGTLTRLGGGTLQEGCFLIPPNMRGHSHDQCPRGNIEKGGDIAEGRALVARSGTAGSRVTVWSAASRPASSWMAYYTALLNQIGFRAKLKLVPDAGYYATIGDLTLHPQTGFGQLTPELQTPANLYERLTGPVIRTPENQNWSEIDDAYVNREVAALASVPANHLGAVVTFWHGLERYLADRAYLAVFGYQTVPLFVSDRLDFSLLHLSPVAGLDWSSLRLK